MFNSKQALYGQEDKPYLRLLDQRHYRGSEEYLVQWKATWVKASDIKELDSARWAYRLWSLRRSYRSYTSQNLGKYESDRDKSYLPSGSYRIMTQVVSSPQYPLESYPDLEVHAVIRHKRVRDLKRQLSESDLDYYPHVST